jgi:DNA-binding response OmpR family regulator
MTNRILLVDDEPDLTSVFGMTLQDSGFEVDTFNDPFLALSNFKADLYHLLLIDVRMPRMDGFALYEKLKNIDDKVKVCFITAYEVDTQALTQRFPGLDIESSIIKKPIFNEDFVRRVNKIINS